MKLWEVIKALTEDPTKKFELSDRGSRERIGSDGNYLRYSRIDSGMISDGPALEDNVDVNNNDWQPEALHMAIEALRKQEAVKPKACHVEPMYDGWHFQGYVQTKSGGVAKHHFCPNCGQRLDWED